MKQVYRHIMYFVQQYFLGSYTWWVFTHTLVNLLKYGMNKFNFYYKNTYNKSYSEKN